MTPEQKDALLALLEPLPAEDLAAVMRFAEFLLSRPARSPVARMLDDAAAVPVASPAPPVEVPPPELIPRPDNEKVVAAVKRLSQSYYMLDKKKMLGVTSDLVTQHILHGREASEVIDELESLFAQHYRQLSGDGSD